MMPIDFSSFNHSGTGFPLFWRSFACLFRSSASASCWYTSSGRSSPSTCGYFRSRFMNGSSRAFASSAAFLNCSGAPTFTRDSSTTLLSPEGPISSWGISISPEGAASPISISPEGAASKNCIISLFCITSKYMFMPRHGPLPAYSMSVRLMIASNMFASATMSKHVCTLRMCPIQFCWFVLKPSIFSKASFRFSTLS